MPVRAAAAALIIFIAVFVNLHLSVTWDMPREDIAKGRPSLFVESVHVINSADKADSLSFVPQVLQGGHERQGHRGPSEPPIIRRLFIAIVGLLLCFLGCSYGLDYEGMFKRAAIVGGGIIAGFVGMALWWAIQFPATWEWPL